MTGQKTPKSKCGDGSCDAESHPCLKSKCPCCGWWLENTGISQLLQEKHASSKNESGKFDGDDDNNNTTVTHQSVKQVMASMTENKKTLEDDLKKTQQANKELQARANRVKIKTVAADPPKEKRPAGRPPGQPATKNTRPQDVDRDQDHDCDVCPLCGKDDMLSPYTTSEYERVASMTRVIKEVVRFHRGDGVADAKNRYQHPYRG